MLKDAKRATLRAFKGLGVFGAFLNSRWRRQRVAILCYHGISIDDEHVWDPSLYMSQQDFEERCRILRDRQYRVLPLGEAVERLRAGTLPGRSVALTFDDGDYDFYSRARPVLRKYGFPATVYQTTYYSEYRRPIFALSCGYMLWKRRDQTLRPGDPIDFGREMNLGDAAERDKIVQHLRDVSEREKWSAEKKDQVAQALAKQVGFDWDAFLKTRILQLMTQEEIRELASEGFDVQLHTHRHRVPMDHDLFAREIRDNRVRLEDWTGKAAAHFCYPSGVYEPEFFPWLEELKVVSATTCKVGLAGPENPSLLLPRIVDHCSFAPIEFEAWLTGAARLIPQRPGAEHRD
jgi:peptidoglycan/xylan/chitin deacetylase (PgdA/CDA1 family)